MSIWTKLIAPNILSYMTTLYILGIHSLDGHRAKFVNVMFDPNIEDQTCIYYIENIMFHFTNKRTEFKQLISLGDLYVIKGGFDIIPFHDTREKQFKSIKDYILTPEATNVILRTMLSNNTFDNIEMDEFRTTTYIAVRNPATNCNFCMMKK